MRHISHDTYGKIFGVTYLVLGTNALVLVAALPLVVLLVTTDPMHSWLLIILGGGLAAPAMTAAFTVFRLSAAGSATVVRDFASGYRATWPKALVIGGMLSAAVVVLLVDMRVASGGAFATVATPTLSVLLLLTLATGLHAFVVLAERPRAHLRDILRSSMYFALRRWYLALVSLAALGVQTLLFTSAPAVAIGVTASGALYVVWANSRFALRPALGLDPDPAR